MSAEFGNLFVFTFVGKLLGCSGAKREASEFPIWEFTPPGLCQPSPHRRRPLDLRELPVTGPSARGQGGAFGESCRFFDFPISPSGLPERPNRGKTRETCGLRKDLCSCSVAQEKWGLKKRKAGLSEAHWEGSHWPQLQNAGSGSRPEPGPAGRSAAARGQPSPTWAPHGQAGSGRFPRPRERSTREGDRRVVPSRLTE